MKSSTKVKKVFVPMTRKKWGQDPKNRYALNQSKHEKYVSLKGEGKVSPFTMQLLPLIEFWEEKEYLLPTTLEFIVAINL